MISKYYVILKSCLYKRQFQIKHSQAYSDIHNHIRFAVVENFWLYAIPSYTVYIPIISDRNIGKFAERHIDAVIAEVHSQNFLQQFDILLFA